MTTVLRDLTPVARKQYCCDACDHVRNTFGDVKFTISELRSIVKARRDGWKIQPGQRYIKQVQVDQGSIFVYRAIPDMDKLCRKYDLFPEW